MAINHNANEFGTHANRINKLRRNPDSKTINNTALRAGENFNKHLNSVLKEKHSGLSQSELEKTADYKHAEALKEDAAIKIEALRKRAIDNFVNNNHTPNNGAVIASYGEKVNAYTALFAFMTLTPSTLKIALDTRNPKGAEKLNVIKTAFNNVGDGKHKISTPEGRKAALDKIITDVSKPQNLTYRQTPQINTKISE